MPLPHNLAVVLDGTPLADIESYMDERKGKSAIQRKAVCIAQYCPKNSEGDTEIHPKKCAGCPDLVVKN